MSVESAKRLYESGGIMFYIEEDQQYEIFFDEDTNSFFFLNPEQIYIDLEYEDENIVVFFDKNACEWWVTLNQNDIDDAYFDDFKPESFAFLATMVVLTLGFYVLCLWLGGML